MVSGGCCGGSQDDVLVVGFFTGCSCAILLVGHGQLSCWQCDGSPAQLCFVIVISLRIIIRIMVTEGQVHCLMGFYVLSVSGYC